RREGGFERGGGCGSCRGGARVAPEEGVRKAEYPTLRRARRRRPRGCRPVHRHRGGSPAGRGRSTAGGAPPPIASVGGPAPPKPPNRMVLRSGGKSFSIPRRVGTLLIVAIAGAIAGAIGAAFHKGPKPAHPLSLEAFDTPMGMSFLLWVAFSVYWEIAAKN